MTLNANILDTVGSTPMVKLSKVIDDCQAEVLAKLEMFNPGGSVKARAALGMITNAEKKGIIGPRTTIVEPTSGNLGVALAMIGAVRGYKVIIVMPDSMSKERRQLIQAYGAEVVLTSGEENLEGAIKKARELVSSIKDAWMPNQFSNYANPTFHEQTTAIEIIEQVDKSIDAFIAGVGTGGTLTGVARVLKENFPDVKIYAVEPSNSAVLSGKTRGAHAIQGIGDGFIPDNLDLGMVDSPFMVTDQQAIAMCARLAREEGILAGVSSGAAAYAAVEIGKRMGPGKTVITIFADTGERYLSTNLYK